MNTLARERHDNILSNFSEHEEDATYPQQQIIERNGVFSVYQRQSEEIAHYEISTC